MKSAGFEPARGRNAAGGRGGRSPAVDGRGRKVGGVLNRRRGLRRNEIVLELQHLRHVAERVAGLRIDRDAHQVIAGAVDQVAVGIDLKIAAAGIVGDAVNTGALSTVPVGFCTMKKPSPLIAMLVATRRGRDRALRGDGLLRIGGDAAGDLPVRRRSRPG